MPNCERCGKYISVYDVHKREIYSGKTNKVYWGKKVTFGNNFRYSIKTVCKECADNIDKGNKIGFYLFLFVIAFIVVLFILGSK